MKKKILKNFNEYIKEDLTAQAQVQNEIETGTIDAMSYAEEEDDEYIGTRLMKELADKLGTEVIDNKIVYDGKTINFYSETEKFHIGNKKFATPDEVINFLDKNIGVSESFKTKRRRRI